MAKTTKQDFDLVIDVDDYKLSEEDKTLFEDTSNKNKQLCRWFLTINNPFWTAEDVEVDINNTELEIKEDYYNLDYVKSFNNIDLFEFHYLEVTAQVDEKKVETILKQVEDEETKEKKYIEVNVEKTVKVTKTFIVERPYFKSYEHFKTYLENMQTDGLNWACGQVEKKNTLHLQFGVVFDRKHSKRFCTMKKYFPTAYLALAKGTNYDIKVYCTKQDTRVEEPFEIGTFVDKGKRTDYDEFRLALKSGATIILHLLKVLIKLDKNEMYFLILNMKMKVETLLQLIYTENLERVKQLLYTKNLALKTSLECHVMTSFNSMVIKDKKFFYLMNLKVKLTYVG